MLNLSKYHKLIVGCSAIATASVSGLVQSADAAGQFNNQNVRSDRNTVLIAGNGSTAGGTGTAGGNGSTAGGGNTAGGNGSTAGGGNTSGGNGSTAGGGGTSGGNGSTGGGTTTGSGKDKDNIAGGNGSTAGGGNTSGGNGSTAGGLNGSNGGGQNGSQNGGVNGGKGPGGIGALAKGIQGRFDTAVARYQSAAQALAAAEAAQPNASSSTSPVRYGREPGDIAACGCPNADTVGGNPAPSKELLAAKAAEAEAAAELAAAKAEARQFLESVKSNSEFTSTGSFQPIW